MGYRHKKRAFKDCWHYCL